MYVCMCIYYLAMCATACRTKQGMNRQDRTELGSPGMTGCMGRTYRDISTTKYKGGIYYYVIIQFTYNVHAYPQLHYPSATVCLYQ